MSKKFSNTELITVSRLPLMRTFFPTSKLVRKMIKPARLNVAHLRMTKEGIYSTTMPDQMLNVYRIMSKHLTRLGLEWRDMTITDATANVGGSTISLALWAKHVNAVEIDRTNYRALEFNIRAYGPKIIKGTTLYNHDYTKIHLRLKQDIIMIDPPWGRDHKLKSPQPKRLYLGKYSVVKLVNSLRKRSKIITLKYPLNFDFREFKQNLDPKFKVTCYQLPFMHYLVLECSPPRDVALQHSESRDVAMQHSESRDVALQHSESRDVAMQHSESRDVVTKRSLAKKPFAKRA